MQKGDFATVKANAVQTVEEELPETMVEAIRIIDRLLT